MTVRMRGRMRARGQLGGPAAAAAATGGALSDRALIVEA